MELRVWVDGTQRVVCGVKLTTTCQEIVFALAHATQQAGRFTMIERWRNNERLLSPNEQPLVTLQRWGDRMNEVEFILKKTSSDPPTQADRIQPIPQMLNHNQSMSQIASTNTSHPSQEVASRLAENDPNSLTNGHGGSPSGHILSTSKQQSIPDQLSDNMLQHPLQYNSARRPQTVLGQIASSNSALNLGSSYLQAQMNRFPNAFRPSLSASTLPNVTNNMNASPSGSMSMLRPLYPDDRAVGTRSPSMLKNDSHNGYTMMNDSQQYQPQQVANQSRVSSIPKNFPQEELYSTINKKRINHLPPAVPAKPRLINPLANPTHSQPMNKAQINYYPSNQSTVTMYSTNVRPRHPPGYLEYLEAMANRNSLPQPLMSNPGYAHQNQLLQSNMFPRQLDQQQTYQNGSSPAGSSASTCYQMNGQSERACFGSNYDLGANSNLQNVTPVNPKFVESSGIVVNRGSAVNVKLHSNSQSISSQNSGTANEILENSTRSTSSASVSQIGHDMLKVIEEQKKVLINQKNELDRLDNDQEYLEAKHNSEQAELINRIESEIQQLEELWSENQAQIKKLENQDFERELQRLKAEQSRMETELVNQRKKLSRFETDIAECQTKIERLESQLEGPCSESDESIIDSERLNEDKNDTSTNDDLKIPLATSNGSNDLILDLNPAEQKNVTYSDDEDDEDDSGGDASDDLSTKLSESKLRNAKEVSYVDKRGLISGIRSLKLDKTRSHNKSVENVNSNDGSLSLNNNSSPPISRQLQSGVNNNIVDTRCSDSNGQQFADKTANSNKYEFLMTL